MTDISAVVQLQETVLQATIGSTDPGSGTDLTLGASVADVLSLAGQQLNAEGPAGDVLLFWDASAGKLTYLNLADGLSITGTNLTVTATGTGTVTSVNISPPAAGITVSGGPITSSGSITLALANDLAAVEGLNTTGIVRRTATNTWSAGTAVDLSSEVMGQLPYTSLSGSPNLSLKADLVGGLVPTSQIPSIAVVEYLGQAANQSAMLALRGQSGDWCIRTDSSTEWVIVANNGASLSDWIQLPNGISPVSSINGQTGAVTLGTGDLLETGGNLYFTAARAIGAALTGFAAGAGTVTAADSILQALQKIVGTIADMAADAAQTLTNKTLGNLRESVFTITDAVGFEINPLNGPLQRVTLGANRTPVFTFLDGQSMKLKINFSTFALTYTGTGGPVVWVGGTVPAAPSSGWLHVEFWREGDVLHGGLVGSTAS